MMDRLIKKTGFTFVIFAFSSLVNTAQAVTEFSGSVALDWQFFPATALLDSQHDSYLSASFEPEVHHSFENNDSSILFTPFLRTDQYDDNRSHADIRELYWQKLFEAYELRIGISKVFWGATESQHLVDIINQTDLVENFDGEDKLGQPMIKLSFERDWGNLDLFILPYFRQRTFPGLEGRLNYALPVDESLVQYESDDKQKHIDYALRYFTTQGDWDIGLSYFNGTSRDPALTPTLNALSQPVLSVYYPLIEQFGLDLTGTVEDLIWKLEIINRHSKSENYSALTGGYEYTFYSVGTSNMDIGLVNEYLYDERGNEAPTPFQNDIMIGLRFNFNDAASTEILAGMIIDLDQQTRIFSVEASRRFSENIKAGLELRVFSSVNQEDPVYSFRNDDYLQASFAYYY